MKHILVAVFFVLPWNAFAAGNAEGAGFELAPLSPRIYPTGTVNLVLGMRPAPARLEMIRAITPSSAAIFKGSDSSARQHGVEIQEALAGEAPSHYRGEEPAVQAVVSMVEGYVRHDASLGPWQAGSRPDHPEVERAARLLENKSSADVEAARTGEETVLQFAHTARGYLATILGGLEMVLGQGIPNNSMGIIVEFAEMAMRGASAARHMMQAQLSLYAVQKEGWKPAIHVFPIHDVIKGHLLRLEDRAKGRKINLLLETRIPERTDAWMDEHAVDVILDNLIGNALKYTGQGGRVSVRILPSESPGYVRISIADTGIGMSEEDVRILSSEGGHRTNAGRAHADGYGLGLQIVHRLLRAMGSKLEIKSELGNGSEFSFELPVFDRRSLPQVLRGR